LNLAGVPQGINSIRLLPVKNKSRDKCSDFISDSINYIQMRRFYLKLASIIKENSDQTGKIQFVFVVGVIGCELYILWPDRIEKVGS